jgi:L-fucose isomerase-like protein
MKNVPDIKLGIVVGSTDWLPSDVAIAQRSKLVETYKVKYGEGGIYECSICITDNEVNIKRALKELDKNECDAICMYFANYGPESAGTLLAEEFEGPVMFFTAGDEGEEPFLRNRLDGMSGFINACYALKLRRTNVYLPENPVGTLHECADMIHEFLPIARTVKAVKDLKVISIGPRPSSYLAAAAPNHLLYDLGVEIAEHSELELLESYKKHEGDARIEKVAAEMAEEFGVQGNKYPEMLPKFAQYEVTVEDWVRNHKGNRKYVTLTSTCWPAFPLSFGFVPCYCNSRLTGKGTPVACEVDVYGALSEYIGQCVSNHIVTILNLNNNIPQSVYDKKIKGKQFNGREYANSDLFLGYHCGVTCSKLLKSCSSELHFVNNQLIGEEKAKGTIHGPLAESPVTLLRIQAGRDNKLRAYVAQGQILPESMETYGGQGIIAVPEMARFLRHVVLEKQFPNHAAIVYGHYGKELVGVLRLLGIQEIDYNHPSQVPYASENIYSSHPEWF